MTRETRTGGSRAALTLLAGALASVLCAALLPATAAAFNISGTVFEDVNYGGGAGRTQAASAGVARAGARIELFDVAGNYVGFTTTNGAGAYSFNGLANGTYTVRVVNGTVTSSRTGYVAGVLAVQTFRTNASGGSAVAVTDRVGGEVPSKADAGNGGTTLGALTTAATAPQSITTVTSGGPNVTGVDFGFNFNTIVNVNDAGQGSLRQFLVNSNALGNAGLAIQGQTAGRDVSLFMISDGLAHPGLRAGIANLLSGAGVAVVTVASALPALTDAATTLDGATQTANVGNTNAALLGTGGTVGVDALALGQVAGPEVEIRAGAAIANGVQIQANNGVVRGLAICGFGSANNDAGVAVGGGTTGALIENDVLGATATSFTDPGIALRDQEGVYSAGGLNGTIRNNLIGFVRRSGIYLNNSTGWTVQGNEVRDIGMETADGDGITCNASSTNSVTANLFTGCSSQGIVVTAPPCSGNTFTNNTVTGNGVGIPSALVQSPGITLRTGSASTTLDRNVIRANFGAGIQVNDGAGGGRLTRNSFADNGTIVGRNGSSATGQIGIDLNSPADNIEFGTAPFVTLNDAGDGDAGGNGLLNFPILVSASLAGGNLVLTGFAAAGSVIELFLANADPRGFGEGETYLLSLTEGGTGAGGTDPYPDTDGGSGTYGPGAINGLAQGTDTANRFTFTFPKPAAVNLSSKLTATATLGGQTSEFSGNVSITVTLSGVVFEDGNYGGGAGRDSATAAGVGRPGARVELYDNAGAFARSTTTDATWAYRFFGLDAGNYTVRVVDDSVGSARAGYLPSLRAVQTYRTDAASGAPVAVTDHVGGQNPTVADAGPGGAGAIMNTATGVFTAGLVGTAQSITNVTAGGPVGHLDFGYSFDVIVNRNDTGQGSLRQFLLNANALANAGLAQEGRPAGIDNAIFMLADGTARPGLSAGYASQFAAGVATIAPASALPAVSAPAVIDAQTQPGWSNAPIVELNGVGAGAGVSGLSIAAGGTTVRGLIVNRFAGPGIAIAAAGGDTVSGCRIGTNAAGTAAAANGGHGIAINGAAANVVGGTTVTARNVLSGNAQYGIWITGAGATGTIVRGNFIGLTATGTAAVPNLSGVAVEGGATATVIGGTSAAARNFVSGNASAGILLGGAGTSGTLVQGNSIGTDSTGVAPVPNASHGVLVGMGAAGNTVGGLVAGAGNVVTASGSHGVVIADAGTRGDAVLGNSIFSNGGIGITLNLDGVTPNNGTKDASLPNDDMDFPVFTSAVLAAGSLTVAGYVGSAPGQATFANARVEVFASDNDASGYGEGRTYLGFLTADAAGGFAGTLAAPGLAVGDLITATATDASNNTSEFGPQRAVAAPVIVKRAFRLDGTAIPSGTVVAKGALFKFLLYIDNPGPAVPDVSLRDALDAGFAYLGGTARFDDSQPTCATGTCSAAEEAAIFAAASVGTAATDALDGDTVSESGGVITAGDQGVANGQLTIAGGRVYALVFTVRMQ